MLKNERDTFCIGMRYRRRKHYKMVNDMENGKSDGNQEDALSC